MGTNVLIGVNVGRWIVLTYRTRINGVVFKTPHPVMVTLIKWSVMKEYYSPCLSRVKANVMTNGQTQAEEKELT